jgi:hypothetical protein
MLYLLYLLRSHASLEVIYTADSLVTTAAAAAAGGVREEEEQQEHEEWRSSRRADAGTYDEVLLNVIVGRCTLTLTSHPPAPVQSTTHTQSDDSDIRTHKRHIKTHTHTKTH